jgi:cAMP-specific phosphodiesterase 4|eukprot:g6614.t1
MGSGVSTEGALTVEALAKPGVDAFEVAGTVEGQRLVMKTLLSGDSGYRCESSEENQAAFLDAIRDGYLTAKLPDNIGYKSYHTLTHAFDVMLTTHSIMHDSAYVFLTPNERTSLIAAAFCHDVLHPGVNNGYFVNRQDALAVKYDNKSILELQSIDFALPLVKQYNIITTEVSEKIFVQSIEWTDMSKHGALMKDVEAFFPGFLLVLNAERKKLDLEEKETGLDQSDLDAGIDLSAVLSPEHKQMLAAFILHCADVSNPVKHWSYCERWAVLVMHEFFGQGDSEKRLNLPLSMNCDRDTVSTPTCQLGFGAFIIKPLFLLLAKLLPKIGAVYLKNFEENNKMWQKAKEEEESAKVPYKMVLQPPSEAGGWLYGEMKNDTEEAAGV